MNPKTCKHFEKCSAPVCPLWEHFNQCEHLNGERVCHWLSEYSKQGGHDRIYDALPIEQAELVAKAHKIILTSRGVIAGRLKRASQTGSRIIAGERMQSRLMDKGA